MQTDMSAINEPVSKQNTKIVERETKIRKTKRHQNSVSTLDGRIEKMGSNSPGDAHCGNEIYLGRSGQSTGHHTDTFKTMY